MEKKQLKIIIVNENGFETGGAETYVFNLKLGLVQRGHQVKILAAHTDDPSRFSDAEFPVIDQSTVLRLFPYMWHKASLDALNRLIEEFKPDLIHYNFIYYNASPSVLSAASRIPSVYTVHGHELIGPMNLKKTEQCSHPDEQFCIHCLGMVRYYPELLKQRILRKQARNIRLFITPSRNHAKLISSYGFGPVKHLYNGIRLAPFQPPSSKPNILFVGRLVEEKGAIHLVRAMKEILKEIPDAMLTVVGDGESREALEACIKKNALQKHVTLTGKRGNKEIMKYYAESQVVVVPSIYPDNLPTVCIEAMSVGRPIIASRIGGLPELVDDGETGYLVEPGNEAELAEKIISVLSNKKHREAMNIKARKKAEQMFSLDTHAEQMEELFINLVSQT